MDKNNINQSLSNGFAKPIPGFSNYIITINGDIYSLKYGKWMKPNTNKNGYVKIVLTKDKQQFSRYVHRLILITFRPIENAADMEANHKDNCRQNNKLSNLEWVTHQQNIEYRNNVTCTTPKGSKHFNSKLNEEIVLEIKNAIKKPNYVRDLAKKYKVERTTIQYVLSGRSWKHVQPGLGN